MKTTIDDLVRTYTDYVAAGAHARAKRMLRHLGTRARRQVMARADILAGY
jgi:hypothetical protein